MLQVGGALSLKLHGWKLDGAASAALSGMTSLRMLHWKAPKVPADEVITLAVHTLRWLYLEDAALLTGPPQFSLNFQASIYS
jgi:hypothetical protein